MEITLMFIGIIAVIFSAIPLIFSVQFFFYIDKYFKTKKKQHYSPKASLIIPCKGIDPGFQENISSLFVQQYPDYELIFVTATSDDPAHELLLKIISKYPASNARIYTSGINEGRSQKINNQICGLKNAADDSRVFVFIDSDSRPNPEFLLNLIDPLSNDSIGITTGFRWYLPIKKGFFSFLRSTWNGGGIVFLSNKKSNYAWGGSMAMCKDVFYKCNVLSYWENALSDDMTISMATRKNGLDICFVPKCLVVTHEDCTFSEMFEWTNRQTIISKVYHPALWKSILFVHGTGNILLLLGAILLILCMTSTISNTAILTASLLMLAIVPMEMINCFFLLPSITKMLPEHKSVLHESKMIYCLMAPLASLLALINSLYSIFTNRITWRGITYEMKSVNETIVCNNGKRSD